MFISTASDLHELYALAINWCMKLGFLLSIVLALHNSVDAAVLKGRRSANGTSATVLTPEFVEFVQQVVDADQIPGLTMAVVIKPGQRRSVHGAGILWILGQVKRPT
ncbi:hypothetical protein BJV77DRAFT_304942 [Russula vinacea]|nr:hypothetical protein BJV77DRAFT_304942 [Russula vinacea]